MTRPYDPRLDPQERWHCYHCEWRPGVVDWFTAMKDWQMHLQKNHPDIYREAVATARRAERFSIAKGAEGD